MIHVFSLLHLHTSSDWAVHFTCPNFAQIGFNFDQFSTMEKTDSFTFNFATTDLAEYSFLPNSLVSMLTYFSMSSTDEGYIPKFFYTKLFLVDPKPNNKVVFSRIAQETWPLGKIE